jgi:hypothetical protein
VIWERGGKGEEPEEGRSPLAQVAQEAQQQVEQSPAPDLPLDVVFAHRVAYVVELERM